MGNVMVIASKEFRDLLSNRMVLLVLIAFTVYAVSLVSLSVVRRSLPRGWDMR